MSSVIADAVDKTLHFLGGVGRNRVAWRTTQDAPLVVISAYMLRPKVSRQNGTVSVSSLLSESLPEGMNIFRVGVATGVCYEQAAAFLSRWGSRFQAPWGSACC